MKIFDPAILNLPFFEERHRQLAGRLEQWVEQNEALPEQWDRADVKDKGRRISRYLGEQGWLELGIDDRGASRTGPDFRSLCLVREALSFLDDLFDFSFSIQSLAVSAIVHHGSERQKLDFLEGVRSGARLGSLAISEPGAGSDVASIRLQAVKHGDTYRLNGEKT